MDNQRQKARETQRRLDHTRKLERRNEILDLVWRGQMHPSEADHIGVEESLEPFTSSPEATSFPIFEEISWSIEMVVAWIVWRDPDWVLKFNNLFRSEVTYWKPFFRGQNLVGYEIDTRGPANFDNLAFLADFRYENEDALLSFREAQRLLWRNLEEGTLVARAIETDSLRVKEIPSYEWGYLVVANTRSATQLRVTTSGTPLYRDVKLDRRRVIETWPAAANGDDSHSSLTAEGSPKRGRPQKYDWPAFRDEVLRRLDDEGDFDVASDPSWTQAALERHMLEWCENKWQGHTQPGESTIRRQVTKTRKQFIKARESSKGP